MLRVNAPLLTASDRPADADARDVVMAGQLQRMLLPPSPFAWREWTTAHRYEPAGLISGDYVDLVSHGDRLYFMLGDVSGKGVVASLLMAQLHAMFRTLIPFDLALDDLMSRASALLCKSSLPAQYATLVAGYLTTSGEVVVSNAGHPPPLVVRSGSQADVAATGLPVGLFCESRFSTATLTLAEGDMLLLYTDGLTEAEDAMGNDYREQLPRAAAMVGEASADALLDRILRDQAGFRGRLRNTDDVSLLAIRRN